MTVPLSVLDLAPISAGSDAGTALHNSVDLAQHAEAWGYRRFWVAEHHFVAVASAAPAVLIGQIASATKDIRVGAAAVQLGFSTAVAVVESFGTLAAFHPGRIDLGVGRSAQRRTETQREVRDGARPARPARVRREVDGVLIPVPFDNSAVLAGPRIRAGGSVLQQPEAQAPDFDQLLADILALIDGSFTVGDVGLSAVPGRGSGLLPWVFGSSAGQSARVAAARGLPFVASYHSTPGTALEAVETYRRHFEPSSALPAPYVVVSADVVVADDEPTARRLAAGYGHWVYGIRAGDGAPPYPDPADCAPLTAEQRAVVADRTETQFVGDPEQVATKLQALQQLSGADELVITSMAYRHEDRLRSHELLAKQWGLR